MSDKARIFPFTTVLLSILLAGGLAYGTLSMELSLPERGLHRGNNNSKWVIFQSLYLPFTKEIVITEVIGPILKTLYNKAERSLKLSSSGITPSILDWFHHIRSLSLSINTSKPAFTVFLYVSIKSRESNKLFQYVPNIRSSTVR